MDVNLQVLPSSFVFTSTQLNGQGNTGPVLLAHVATGIGGEAYSAYLSDDLPVEENGKTYGDKCLPLKGNLDFECHTNSIIDILVSAKEVGSFDEASYCSIPKFGERKFGCRNSYIAGNFIAITSLLKRRVPLKHFN